MKTTGLCGTSRLSITMQINALVLVLLSLTMVDANPWDQHEAQTANQGQDAAVDLRAEYSRPILERESSKADPISDVPQDRYERRPRCVEWGEFGGGATYGSALQGD